MLRTIICCLLSALAITIGGCVTSQESMVAVTAAAESTSPLAATVLHTLTPAAQQPPSPVVTPDAGTAPRFASYIGPNAYRQSYPDFIVYYDPTQANP